VRVRSENRSVSSMQEQQVVTNRDKQILRHGPQKIYYPYTLFKVKKNKTVPE
jgi:hypothetical protein